MTGWSGWDRLWMSCGCSGGIAVYGIEKRLYLIEFCIVDVKSAIRVLHEYVAKRCVPVNVTVRIVGTCCQQLTSTLIDTVHIDDENCV